MKDLAAAAKGEDAGAIRASMERLNRAAQKIGEVLYKKAAAGGAGGPGGPAGPGPSEGPAPAGPKDDKKDGDVIDAEFEVK